MRVYCEYLKNPIGIDMEHPRFSWIVDKSAQAQKAYRILVYHDDCCCEKKEHIVWDSGEVESEETLNIAYAGAKLETAQTYYYRIFVTDRSGNTTESGINSFTMGIMEKDPWKAPWLGGPWMEEQAFWFRGSVQIEKPVKEAYIYAVSANYYVLTVNGKRCGDEVLQNANTDSKKTVLYATYPVKQNLRAGENVIGIELGNGWRALSLGIRDVGLGEHSFSVQMLILYEDGTSEWVYSNTEDWKYTKEGPIGSNSIYQGESYDARKELTGWDMPGYDLENSGVEWFEAVEFEPEEGEVRAQYLEPIRVVATMKPRRIYEIGDGSYTFDMGQNFAGWARLCVKGERGTKITLVYSELEYEDHTVNQISLRNMRAADSYILKGDDIEIYEPRFTFHGFRYVQVFGLTQAPEEETLTGCVVRSAVERVGEFTCDNPLINQLQSNICWTEESNLHSIPTDCPQRDERLGWINDMTVRNECALYNYRLASLYTKWMRDIRDTQGIKTGAITDTAPFRVFGCRPADPVGASLLLVPWNMYLHYQDKRILEENYDAIWRYLEYLRRNSTDYIMRWATMGDWAAPISDNDTGSIGGGAVSMVTPPRLIATAFFYYDCTLAAKIAEVLEKKEDAEFFRKQSLRIKDAFIRHYYHPEKKYVYSNSQGCNTIALYLGLIPEEDREAVLKNLVEDIVDTHNMHLSTGNMCSRYIIEVLLTNGYEDVAYSLLTQTTYPSWGYMIENGATTVWERWEQIVEECGLSIMASYNHPMYGAVGVCFYKYFAGIDVDETAPGFKNVIIRPIVPEKLRFASASVDTMRGIVKNEWKKENDGLFVMKSEIPFNCGGTIYVPLEKGTANQTRVTLNGKIIYDGGMTDCCVVAEEDGYLVFSVTAGSYVTERSKIV